MDMMLADYGVFYFDTPMGRKEKSGGLINGDGFSYPYMAGAMGAYAAVYYKDKELASKVWTEILSALEKNGVPGELKGQMLIPGLNQEKYEEWPWVSTNFISQWCLNVIFCLELIGNELQEE